MNIVGTNQDEKDKKNKKLMIWMTIIFSMLFVISIILFITIYYLTGQLFKFYINDNKISTFDKDLFVYDGDKVYISLDDIAELIGYKMKNGTSDDKYTEDKTKRYLECENEIVNFEKNKDIIYKTPVGQEDYSYYKISEPIMEENGKLYINAKDLERACNVSFSYDSEKNTIKINTLQYYVNYFMTNNVYASVATNFNNQKAILYGFLIIQDVPNTSNDNKASLYGIADLNGKRIVSEKYTGIEYMESMNEFIVRSEEGKFGIISPEGNTKIAPEYDSIRLIHKDLELFLVTKDNKQGIMKEDIDIPTGKVVLYPEYEKIGIDVTDFPKNDFKNNNPYVLFDTAIPVKQNGKWGLLDTNRNVLLPIKYAEIGCTSVPNGAYAVAFEPLKKLIVVAEMKTELDERGKEISVKKYGLVTNKGVPVIENDNTVFESIYSIVSNGRMEYKMRFNNVDYDLIEWANNTPEIKRKIENNTAGEINIEGTNTKVEEKETNTKTDTKTNTKTNTVVNEETTNTTVNELNTNTAN